MDIITKMLACGLSNTRSDHQNIINSSSRKNSKVDTVLDLKNYYNHFNMCLNAVTIILEDLLPDYQSIK